MLWYCCNCLLIKQCKLSPPSSLRSPNVLCSAKNGVYQWLVHASFLWQFYLENVLWICQTSCTILWQIVFQILSGTFLHDHPIDLNHSNIPEDNKQIFSKNWLFCGLSRHLSKLVVSCCNEKVGKNGKDKTFFIIH